MSCINTQYCNIDYCLNCHRIFREQKRVAKAIISSQEEAFWRLHRPPVQHTRPPHTHAHSHTIWLENNSYPPLAWQQQCEWLHPLQTLPHSARVEGVSLEPRESASWGGLPENCCNEAKGPHVHCAGRVRLVCVCGCVCGCGCVSVGDL